MATGSQANVDLAYMDQSRPDLQVVKCVVVGDMGVGKTRLICARACGTQYSLTQLIQTHVPTVWAIDHYRKDREVLDQSWCTVDGLNVSLRLWDTFGYHDKDRRFAYGRADVILLCFSLVRPRTLRNAVNHWYPEIRRLCGNLPIVLCGCQADLRYLYRDPHFQKIEKGPFFREILDEDVVSPEKARAVAQEIGAFYYESSVLERYGIHDVFLNVCRAALTHKREKHFWNVLGSLKRIQRPLAQAPLLPKQPLLPHIDIPKAHVTQDLYKLLEEQSYCDVIFIVRGVCIQAHKSVLVCAHDVFKELFLTDFIDSANPPSSSKKLNSSDLPRQSSAVALRQTASSHFRRQSHGHQHGVKLVHKFVQDTAILLDNEEVNSSLSSLSDNMSSLSDIGSSLSDNVGGGGIQEDTFRRRTLNHPAFTCVQLQQCEDVYADFSPASNVVQTIVTVSSDITPSAFQHVLAFLYTGRFMNENMAADIDTLHAAKLIGIAEVAAMYTNCVSGEGFLNRDLEQACADRLLHNMNSLLIQHGFLADVLFCLEDGEVSAHKPLLMARCDMMYGMFSYNFRESSSKLVQFPGVSVRTFRALQEYLYTGTCRGLHEVDTLELIELANRMCLDGLVAIAEQHTACELRRREEAGANVMEDVLAILEIAQLHNAEHLADFCLWYLCCNYTAVYRRYAKLIGQLTPSNQIYLNTNRWPPLWYLKEVDYYERTVLDQERARAPRNQLIRTNSDDREAGCLGFCGRKNRRLKAITTAES